MASALRLPGKLVATKIGSRQRVFNEKRLQIFSAFRLTQSGLIRELNIRRKAPSGPLRS